MDFFLLLLLLFSKQKSKLILKSWKEIFLIMFSLHVTFKDILKYFESTSLVLCFAFPLLIIIYDL